MKVKYLGRSFGGLINENTYKVLGVDELTGALRVIDESEEDYLYSPTDPKPICGDGTGGKFFIIEDDENQTLKKAMRQ